jgi:hypothetical protein
MTAPEQNRALEDGIDGRLHPDAADTTFSERAISGSPHHAEHRNQGWINRLACPLFLAYASQRRDCQSLLPQRDVPSTSRQERVAAVTVISPAGGSSHPASRRKQILGFVLAPFVEQPKASRPLEWRGLLRLRK